jgi:hypothetical protein
MVPIDCPEVAEQLNVHVNIMFGRLYYHLEKKHGYDQQDGSRVAFFALQCGKDRYCVNLPLLASVLAEFQEQQTRFIWPLILSVIALTVSLFK